MPAYIIANMTVTKPEAYEGYRALAAPAVAKHGGRFLVRGGKNEVLEGAFPASRVVVVEFETYEGANHAFDNDIFVLHHPEASKLAWQRTLDFLSRRLSVA